MFADVCVCGCNRCSSYPFNRLVCMLVLFRIGGKTPDPKQQARTYMDVMREQHLSKEEVGCLLYYTTGLNFTSEYIIVSLNLNTDAALVASHETWDC